MGGTISICVFCDCVIEDGRRTKKTITKAQQNAYSEDTKLSHGYCEICAEKHYPDIVSELKEEGKWRF